MQEKRVLTSIVSYPERGEGGNNKYRGNCSPKLVEDLIGFYKPNTICDYMCGSGTTGAAANSCGIESHLYDLHSGFDIMNCDIPERSEFTFWHPPYWDIIKYSDVMYKAADVKAKFGYDPMQFDLSRVPSWEGFVEAMNYAMMKQFAALEKGGRIAVLMGDIKRKGRLYSMLAEIAKPGTMEQIIIKAQHNCFSDRTQYTGKSFIPIQHEYVLICRKDEPLVIPVMLSKTYHTDIRDMRGSTWRDVIYNILASSNEPMSLDNLYAQVDGHAKTKDNQHWQEKIRQTLQRHPNYFRHTDRGMWQAIAA